jgi:hypothetical protein
MTYTREDLRFGPFNYFIDGRDVSHQYSEKWLKLESRTVRCGISTSLTFSKTTGVSTKELTTVTDTITSSIGPAAVASIKAAIRESTSNETTISESETRTVTFDCPAFPCGRCTYDFHQRARDHRIEIRKERLFRRPLVVRADFRELTNEYDVRCERDEGDPACPCPEPDLAGEGVVNLTFGNLSVRLDGEGPEGKRISIAVGKKVLTLNLDDGPAFAFVVRRDELPEMFVLLSSLPDYEKEVMIKATRINDDNMFSWEGETQPSFELGAPLMPRLTTNLSFGQKTNKGESAD